MVVRSCGEYGIYGRSWANRKVHMQIAVTAICIGGMEGIPAWSIHLTMLPAKMVIDWSRANAAIEPCDAVYNLTIEVC